MAVPIKRELVGEEEGISLLSRRKNFINARMEGKKTFLQTLEVPVSSLGRVCTRIEEEATVAKATFYGALFSWHKDEALTLAIQE